MRLLNKTFCALMLSSSISSAAHAEWELNGSLDVTTRAFTERARWLDQEQESLQFAIAGDLEFRWRGDNTRLSIIPVARHDLVDTERSLFDFREAYWALERGDYELLIGINTVFWGVTESVHLVDVINQTDAVADIDGEDKLGQPMVNLEIQRDWGRISAYVLPYFRERTFPGRDGRLRTPVPIDTDNPVYESSDEENQVDFALRYSHFIGNIDIGLSAFNGTSREPRFLTSLSSGLITPYYDQIVQLGIDFQYTGDAWLWKLEAIARETQNDSFLAAVGGFEYTLFGISQSATDLGVLLEIQLDDRAENEAFVLSDNDIFSGVRLALNDTQDTTLLAGIAYDWESNETFINIEAERRFGNTIVLELQTRIFTNTTPDDTSFTFENDDYLQLRCSWFF